MVLLKLAVHPNREWTYPSLAHDLAMSVSEVHAALKRAERSVLFSRELRSPLLANLEEFLVHGVRYAYPPEIGGITRGVATAGSHPVFLEELANFTTHNSISTKSNNKLDERYVWPYAEGTQRGMSLSPLYKSAPQAANNDPLLYTALALVDALRLGRKRDMDFAKRRLKKLVQGNRGLA